MLKMDDVKQHVGEARPALHMTDWNPEREGKEHVSPSSFEELSPRSKGNILTGNDEFPFNRESKGLSSRLNSMEAARVASSRPEPRPSTTGITPDFVSELRCLIREENKTMIQEALKEYHKDKQQGSVDVGPSGSDETSRSSPSQPSPRHSPSSHASQLPVAEVLRQASQGLNKTPVPPAPMSRSIGVPHSPTMSHASQSSRTSSVRFEDDSQYSPGATRDALDRSLKTPSNRASVELSVVDQKWGVLFDNDGHPTGRLRHILTGLAEYIAARFLPQNSIVITPEKLAAFYYYYRLEQDTYPFAAVFKAHAKDFNERLADLYQDLDCQYHLVQVNTRSRPSVPCLTPAGFAQWMITHIQAHPDDEAKRLQTIVSAIPIDVESPLDGKPERLPVQISRHLLPEKSLKRSRDLLDEAMLDFMEDLDLPVFSRSPPGQHQQRPVPSEKRSSDVSPRSRYIPTALEGNPNESRHSSHIGPEAPLGSHPKGVTQQGMRSHRMSSGDSSRPPSRDPYNMPRPPVGRNSIPRRNRSPQRRTFSQSVPGNIGDGGLYGASSSTNSSVVFTPSSASMSPTSEVATLRGNDGEYRVYPPLSRDRPSLDESTPRAGSTINLRDHASRTVSDRDAAIKRRSLVTHDSRGPTWDEVLRQGGKHSG